MNRNTINGNISKMKSMMKNGIYAALLTGLVMTSTAQASEYTAIQTDQSTLNFTYKQMGVAMDGSFKKFNAQISFDPAKPANAKATFDLDLASIDTGSEEADDEVKGKNWFNAKVFPRARFESTSFKPLGGNRYEVSGKMTIKGKTQPVNAAFTFSPQGKNALADGAFILKRADYGIGEGAWSDFSVVANEIQIRFHFLASAGFSAKPALPTDPVFPTKPGK